MKVIIDSEEWWPVYEIMEYGAGYEIDIPEEKVERIKDVFAQFQETQNYLREIYKSGNLGERIWTPAPDSEVL